jgi:hypothetical protein
LRGIYCRWEQRFDAQLSHFSVGSVPMESGLQPCPTRRLQTCRRASPLAPSLQHPSWDRSLMRNFDKLGISGIMASDEC